ncbi:MAG: FtsW/RodA/SpoVE family cell cycle protein [Bacteroidales bacterium]|nr:FtsW/RodA/SpoVE family cell cycle protein [Bacteroidales bacterium]MDE5808713.1 FtsW/RodA/SpoVE family cell cycle protein [Muribaculaceae bacterium]
MEQTLNQQPTQSPELEESKLPKTDKYILGIYILLLIVSVIELYSASSFEVRASNVFAPLIRHGMMLVAGILIVLGLSRINYRWFIPLIPLFVIFSVCLAGYVLVAGEIINGARRSITMLGITFQPAEFLKLSAVLSLALIMSRSQSRQGVKTWGIVTSSITVLIFGGLLFPQGLTNTLLLMGISLSMMLIGGIQWRKFFIVLGCYAVIAGCGYIVKAHLSEDSGRTGTWKQRVERYFDKSQPMYEKEITSINRQEMYGYMAQAHGGIIGVMPGNSRETSRLPLAFSDYIFSIVVEDLGLVGGCALLLFYLSLMARAGNIARQCKRAFPALLVIGMAVMIVLQALFHMAIVTGVFPVSGQPLPLISKGGSSILITSIAFGIMLSVSRFATQSKAKKHEYDPETELLPEEVQAINPMQID